MTTTPCDFVWDASALHHAARADRLDVLGEMVSPPRAGWSHYSTQVVAEELGKHGLQLPGWIDVLPMESLAEIKALAHWTVRVSAGTHNIGEATVAAAADVRRAIPIVDDSEARKAMQVGGLAAHGLCWLLCESANLGHAQRAHVCSFLDTLIAAGARYPFALGGFLIWAKEKGLLDYQTVLQIPGLSMGSLPTQRL